MQTDKPRHFPAAAPDGLLAALLLSFLTTAGLFYVNIMPALVSGLIDGLHFTERQAGFVASSNVYGAAFGALAAVFFVKHIAWRPAAIGFLCTLIVIDVISTAITSPNILLVARFVQGSVGGMLIGTAFSVIARTEVPERTFGMLLFVQFGIGGVGLMVLPRLVPIFGTPVLFLALALFSLVTLCMVPFLSDYPRRDVATRANGHSIDWRPLIFALVSVFLFQAGNMALAAYMIELGRFYGLKIEFISTTLGIAGWIAALGSLLVVFMGTRFGRVMPLAIAFVLTIAGNALFHLSASQAIYVGANAATAVTWAYVMPYLLGMCAAFDATGQTAALGGFCSKLGLATGPLVAGLILNGSSFSMLINVSVAALALSGIFALAPAIALDRLPLESGNNAPARTDTQSSIK